MKLVHYAAWQQFFISSAGSATSGSYTVMRQLKDSYSAKSPLKHVSSSELSRVQGAGFCGVHART